MVSADDGDSMVLATVTGLTTPGALYCLTVAAVSGRLQSQQSDVLCSYTGESIIIIIIIINIFNVA